ncbi:MAG: hypothetical protein ACRBN8_35465 [Nannocystales bacterium]
MESLPLTLLVFLIVVAVIAGLWVGGRANREVETRREEGKSVVTRARQGAQKAVVSLFLWNRKRKRERDDKKD